MPPMVMASRWFGEHARPGCAGQRPRRTEEFETYVRRDAEHCTLGRAAVSRVPACGHVAAAVSRVPACGHVAAVSRVARQRGLAMTYAAHVPRQRGHAMTHAAHVARQRGLAMRSPKKERLSLLALEG